MNNSFAGRLHERIKTLNTRICLGLDPRTEAHPNTQAALHKHDPEKTANAVFAHCQNVMEACAPFVCSVKPNIAYFEVLGLAGLKILLQLLENAKTLGLEIILDAKRGDFPATAEAYASAWLTKEHAGNALTINPFLGFETITPFLNEARKNNGAIFALVKTSNPGSQDLQAITTPTGSISEMIAVHLASLANQENDYGAIGAVVGATHSQELAHYRKLMPKVLMLLPGLGAQGAKANQLAAAFDNNGLGAIATASRAIQYASKENNYAEAARQAAKDLRDELNSALL